MKALGAMVVVILAAQAAGLARAEPLLQPGRYEVRSRLELPHLERWAIDKKSAICVPATRPADAIPLPILAENSPFAGCVAQAVRRAGDRLDYRVVCPGRDAARAAATYRLAEGRFRGRIDMVMGAKNMTMTEQQTGQRVGSCEVAQGAAD